MKAFLLLLLFFCTSASFAQPTDPTYYSPYNFPEKYEFDNFNRHVKLTFSLPLTNGLYSALDLSLMLKKFPLTEYLQAYVGLSFFGAANRLVSHQVEIEGQKGFDFRRVQMFKTALSGGLLFRKFNPFNFLVFYGIAGGPEYLESGSQRPVYRDDLTDGMGWYPLRYSQSTTHFFRHGYCYGCSLLIKTRTIAWALSLSVVELADGAHGFGQLGIAIPYGN